MFHVSSNHLRSDLQFLQLAAKYALSCDDGVSFPMIRDATSDWVSRRNAEKEEESPPLSQLGFQRASSYVD